MLTKFGLLNLSQVLKIASRFIELRNAHDVSVSVVILNVSNLFVDVDGQRVSEETPSSAGTQMRAASGPQAAGGEFFGTSYSLIDESYPRGFWIAGNSGGGSDDNGDTDGVDGGGSYDYGG
ncbi:unnamed protein product [Enterobius vermicularis]|uniref:Uncharacterized protein n=1 Tax=Enterobius vermicularis TaxID=51028 RepID=A0A0N4V351_ENTVE|nr:unnamed protein product [Enterobius vermicularis]